MRLPSMRRTLQFDAVIHLLFGLGLIVFAHRLSAPAGLRTSWPVAVLGAAFLFSAGGNWIAASTVSRASIVTVVTGEALFVVAAVIVSTIDPSGAAAWLRAALLVLAVAAFAMAALKTRVLIRAPRHRAGRTSGGRTDRSLRRPTRTNP